MAGISLLTLRQTTRRFLRDWPVFEQLGASLSSSATSITVADSSLYGNRWMIDVDQETMLITNAANPGTTLTVIRGIRGSTAATHAAGADILMDPNFYAMDIIDAINMGIDACWPFFYQLTLDTSVTSTDSTYEYAIPNMPGTYAGGATIQIPVMTKLEILQTSDLTYRELRRWQIVVAQDGSRKFKLRTAEPALGTFRVTGFGPFPHLTNDTDTLDESWPKGAQYLPALYAAAHLLMSAEAGRDRADFEGVDRREEANRAGISLQTGQQLYQRWMREVLQNAMPPIRRHFQQPI